MHPDQVRRVRRFNRTVTQRVGALENDYLDRGRPLGEARLLWEIGESGAELRELRGRLGIDSGYLSRLLKSLETQGLVDVVRAPEDARRRCANLTPAGRAELAAYDDRSDALAASMLEPLEADQRERLVAAMSEVERLIRMASLEISLESPDSADGRRCLEAYFNELALRFETGFDLAKDASAPDAAMTPPQGYFFVARLDGAAVGCCGMKVVDADTGEAKRFWIDPSVRRLGVGRRLLRATEAKARELGMTRLRLDTNRVLREAKAFYAREGFEETAPFNDELYAHHWFQKAL